MNEFFVSASAHLTSRFSHFPRYYMPHCEVLMPKHFAHWPSLCVTLLLNIVVQLGWDPVTQYLSTVNFTTMQLIAGACGPLRDYRYLFSCIGRHRSPMPSSESCHWQSSQHCREPSGVTTICWYRKASWAMTRISSPRLGRSSTHRHINAVGRRWLSASVVKQHLVCYPTLPSSNLPWHCWNASGQTRPHVVLTCTSGTLQHLNSVTAASGRLWVTLLIHVH